MSCRVFCHPESWTLWIVAWWLNPSLTLWCKVLGELAATLCLNHPLAKALFARCLSLLSLQWSSFPVLCVPVVVLAEDRAIQEKLAYYDLKVQTMAEISPIQVYPARVLSHLFSHLGKMHKVEEAFSWQDHWLTVDCCILESHLLRLGMSKVRTGVDFLDAWHMYYMASGLYGWIKVHKSRCYICFILDSCIQSITSYL